MNTASGGHGIPAELLQILKDDAVKVLHSMRQQIWKTQQWPHEKDSFHSILKEGQCHRMFKLPDNYIHFLFKSVYSQWLWWESWISTEHIIPLGAGIYHLGKR